MLQFELSLNLSSLPSSWKLWACQPCVHFKEKWEERLKMSLQWRPSASSFSSFLRKGHFSQARQIWHETDPSWIRDHDQSDSHARQANILTARSHTHVPYFVFSLSYSWSLDQREHDHTHEWIPYSSRGGRESKIPWNGWSASGSRMRDIRSRQCRVV